MRTKRATAIFVLMAVMVLAFFVSACELKRVDFTITFETDSESVIESQILERTSLIPIPQDPIKPLYTFVGWYKDASRTTAWNFDTDTVTGNTTLYALWSENKYLVTFNTDGGTAIQSQLISETGHSEEPFEIPYKIGNAFAGWYKDSQYSSRFIFEEEAITEETTIYAKWVELNANTLYLNDALTDEQLNSYSFRNLQDLKAAAGNDTVVYIAPSVYWTDDRDNPVDASPTVRGLIGISFPQTNLTFIGVTGKPEDVIIAGNRGQTLGSQGNWNVIGIGNGFNAYNVTVGNYCNVDLVYARDSSKNVAKRAANIVQAQTITNASGASGLDKLIFDNCRFISFLNLLAISSSRVYYKDCFFQSTDDAIGGGAICVFENCEFDFYGQHPSGGGASNILAYLGCRFNGKMDITTNPNLYYSKSGGSFAVIDGVYEGPMTGLEWENTLNVDARHYVSNNTLNGQPVTVSPGQLQMSVNLSGELLNAYKVGDEYNIYNIVRQNDDWDPANQKERLAAYANLPLKFLLSGTKSIDANASQSTTISFSVFPTRAASSDVVWDYDENVLELVSVNESTGAYTFRGINDTGARIVTRVTATLSGGYTAGATITISPILTTAPTYLVQPTMTIHTDLAVVNYTLDRDLTDASTIIWYRCEDAAGTNPIEVAVSRGVGTMVDPLRVYTLSKDDVGYYLKATVKAKYEFSYAMDDTISIIADRAITAADVTSQTISANFKNISLTKQSMITDGFWYVDCNKPSDVTSAWTASTTSAGWTYMDGNGSGGAAGRSGLMTTTQGARLLYGQTGSYGDMSLTLTLSPEKSAGQGFGSATSQYLDVYIKYDVHTKTGYGIRVYRTSGVNGADKACLFVLYEWVNGVGTALGTPVLSSAYLTVCTIELNMQGTTLSAHVTSTAEQSSGQLEIGLPHELNFTAEVTGNTYGGFGIQHTGTVSSGNRTLLESLTVTADKTV